MLLNMHKHRLKLAKAKPLSVSSKVDSGLNNMIIMTVNSQ